MAAEHDLFAVECSISSSCVPPAPTDSIVSPGSDVWKLLIQNAAGESSSLSEAARPKI